VKSVFTQNTDKNEDKKTRREEGKKARRREDNINQP
jgi:hypothetical protein